MAMPPFAPHFVGWSGPWEFADPDTTLWRLGEAGFEDIATSLEAAPVVFGTAEEYRSFVETVIFRVHLERLPPGLRAPFLDQLVDAARAEDPPFSLDYWRLNLSATRPAT
jgi:trans-aconitate 2-methyltransferase